MTAFDLEFIDEQGTDRIMLIMTLSSSIQELISSQMTDLRHYWEEGGLVTSLLKPGKSIFVDISPGTMELIPQLVSTDVTGGISAIVRSLPAPHQQRRPIRGQYPGHVIALSQSETDHHAALVTEEKVQNLQFYETRFSTSILLQLVNKNALGNANLSQKYSIC